MGNLNFAGSSGKEMPAMACRKWNVLRAAIRRSLECALGLNSLVATTPQPAAIYAIQAVAGCLAHPLPVLPFLPLKI